MPRRSRRPALTPEVREQQLVSAAFDLAEKQLTEGTASAQVITTFLKAGMQREKAEQKRLENENALLQAKVESLQSAKKVEELYGEALKAMRQYAGQDVEEEEPEYDGY